MSNSDSDDATNFVPEWSCLKAFDVDCPVPTFEFVRTNIEKEVV